MWEKIVAFFMSVISFIASLFGFDIFNKFDAVAYENLAYGEHERQVLDLYLPAENDGEVGLILMIHGGAWVAGDKADYSEDSKGICEDYGYAAAAMNYRYIGEDVSIFDVADDITAALAAIKAKGAENGIEINKVLLTGASAGAHLSMFYAYSRVEEAPITPVAVFSNCGPTDLTDENFYVDNLLGVDMLVSLFSKCIGDDTFTYENRADYTEALKSVSPLYYVNENTVPTVINHGMKDNVVPYSNALSIVEAFEKYGVKYDFNIYPESSHSLSGDKNADKAAEKLFAQYATDYLGTEIK